jgi:Rrf2 family protein
MTLTARTQYACLAMSHLAAERGAREPTPLRAIAERHGIPATFLVQILNQLKRAGLVVSERGAGGGYRLKKPPGEISLAEVAEAIEPADAPTCAAARSPLSGAMIALAQQLQAARRACLAEWTLADMVARAAAGGEPMWYI